MITPPSAKPSIVSVNGSVASARGTPNSACTAGNATTTDHMPTPPTVDTSMVAPRRSHACVEFGRGLFQGFRCRRRFHRATFTGTPGTVNPCCLISMAAWPPFATRPRWASNEVVDRSEAIDNLKRRAGAIKAMGATSLYLFGSVAQGNPAVPATSTCSSITTRKAGSTPSIWSASSNTSKAN